MKVHRDAAARLLLSDFSDLFLWSALRNFESTGSRSNNHKAFLCVLERSRHGGREALKTVINEETLPR
jgi:hypothetical protein